MRSLKWILFIFANGLISTAGGLFLPNFINFLRNLPILNWLPMPKEDIPNDIFSVILWSIVIFLSILFIELVIYSQSSIERSKKSISKSVEDTITEIMPFIMKNSIFSVLQYNISRNQFLANSINSFLNNYFERLEKIQPNLRPILAQVLSLKLNDFIDEFSEISTSGLNLSISEQINIYDWLCKESKKFIIIETAIRHPINAWTNEFYSFLNGLVQNYELEKRFILFVPIEIFNSKKDLIIQTKKVINQYNFSLFHCDPNIIKDSTGYKKINFDVAEIFDNDLVALYSLQTGVYRGGNKNNIRFIDLSISKNNQKIFDQIIKHSKEV